MLQRNVYARSFCTHVHVQKTNQRVVLGQLPLVDSAVALLSTAIGLKARHIRRRLRS